MPAPHKRSTSFRKVHKKVPGGNRVTHYEKRKPGKAKCVKCRAVLKGVASKRPYKMQNMAKSKKRPERPFGGVLCSNCMREHYKQKAIQV